MFRAFNLVGIIFLLKVVFQSIPIYQLSGVVAPKTYCSTMVDIFKKFLRVGAQQLNKWDLVSWNNLTQPKIVRGLSLWDPFTLNQVMGAKILW